MCLVTALKAAVCRNFDFCPPESRHFQVYGGQLSKLLQNTGLDSAPQLDISFTNSAVTGASFCHRDSCLYIAISRPGPGCVGCVPGAQTAARNDCTNCFVLLGTAHQLSSHFPNHFPNQGELKPLQLLHSAEFPRAGSHVALLWAYRYRRCTNQCVGIDHARRSKRRKPAGLHTAPKSHSFASTPKLLQAAGYVDSIFHMAPHKKTRSNICCHCISLRTAKLRAGNLKLRKSARTNSSYVLLAREPATICVSYCVPLSSTRNWYTQRSSRNAPSLNARPSSCWIRDPTRTRFCGIALPLAILVEHCKDRHPTTEVRRPASAA